ncbi:MAG: hypothetical protein PHP63_08860 [Candidatus Marinimicrobia bacterium]|jgi:Zn-dependent membrane protease YugP|nr:hypothetical protein [Candidatus Neomarinimicrobiota bacterium]
MDVSREAKYLTMLLGVVVTCIGFMYTFNTGMFVSMPLNIQLGIIWFSIGVLFMLNGVMDMYDGAQQIVEEFRKKKEEKK